MSDQIPEKMQAVVCHGPLDYRLEEVSVPQRRAGEALIRVEAVGICASDLKCYHGAAKFWGDENRPAWTETMVIPGHGRLSDEQDVIEYRDMVTIIRDRIREYVKRGMTLEQVKAKKPTLDWDARYNTNTFWTADQLIALDKLHESAVQQPVDEKTTHGRRKSRS